MRRREHEWCVLLLAFITSCGHYVMPDGASDSGGTDAIAAPDTRDASVRDTRDAEDVRDAMDAMDAMDVEDASDVVDVDVFGPDADDAD
ncbi:MAG: hypothetical protein Q8Q09_10810, partial [Deltaproteobacteria bacterium]|nr:hypothetical protein [Deltaproteobacteria bacterium]